MQPLFTRTDAKKNYWCKSLCAIAAIIVITSICLLGYFSTGTNLNSQSPAKNLVKKHNTNTDEISLPQTDFESFYPTEINVDPDRVIIPSDVSLTSDYYKSNGQDDLITVTMPGLKVSTCANSPSNCQNKQYSGYLLANDNREIHYWFIQAEVHPHKQPVFIWTNGGPGIYVDNIFLFLFISVPEYKNKYKYRM